MTIIRPQGPKVTLTLTTQEASYLRSAARQELTKRRKRIDPDFVPAPGHLDANKVMVVILDGLLKRLDQLLEKESDK